jgi:hypothetical protein
MPSYDDFGRLIQLTVTRTVTDTPINDLSGSDALRGEADTDGDGRIDRWEYFDVASALTRVGTSSRGDGGHGLIPRCRRTASDGRDLMTSRSRVRSSGVFSRPGWCESKTTPTATAASTSGALRGIGVARGGSITSFSHGRADRRALYDETGRFSRLEEDPDGDGMFVRVEGAQPATRCAGSEAVTCKAVERRPCRATIISPLVAADPRAQSRGAGSPTGALTDTEPQSGC